VSDVIIPTSPSGTSELRATRTDAERLDWLATQDGGALVSDDFGRWAVSHSGMQQIPEGIWDKPCDLGTSFWVEAHEWRASVREAIDARMDAVTSSHDSRDDSSSDVGKIPPPETDDAG
jgi:hypothetical protein